MLLANICRPPPRSGDGEQFWEIWYKNDETIIQHYDTILYDVDACGAGWWLPLWAFQSHIFLSQFLHNAINDGHIYSPPYERSKLWRCLAARCMAEAWLVRKCGSLSSNAARDNCRQFGRKSAIFSRALTALRSSQWQADTGIRSIFSRDCCGLGWASKQWHNYSLSRLTNWLRQGPTRHKNRSF